MTDLFNSLQGLLFSNITTPKAQQLSTGISPFKYVRESLWEKNKRREASGFCESSLDLFNNVFEKYYDIKKSIL